VLGVNVYGDIPYQQLPKYFGINVQAYNQLLYHVLLLLICFAGLGIDILPVNEQNQCSVIIDNCYIAASL